MKDLRFKKILSLICVICLFAFSGTICYASGLIYGPDVFNMTNTGIKVSTFTVSNEYDYHQINVHFQGRPGDGANSSAVFSFTVTGNNFSKTLYLPANRTTQVVTIGNLPAGSYKCTVRPYASVSGSYVCVFQIYAY